MAKASTEAPEATTENLLAEANNTIAKLKAESAEKDALIDELQKALEAQDHSGLDIPAFPTVKHEGVVYEVTAKKFKLKKDPKEYVLADLKDAELVAKLIAGNAGFLKAKK